MFKKFNTPLIIGLRSRVNALLNSHTPFRLPLREIVALLLLLYCCGLTASAHANAAYNSADDQSLAITGKVLDVETGEPLQGVSIFLPVHLRGDNTDSNGVFEISGLAQGEYLLIARFVGYETMELSVELPLSEPLLIELQQTSILLDDVIVTASPVRRNIRYQPATAYNRIDLQERQGASMGELLDGEPGISMRSFGPAPARPVIRGFDGDRLLILENGERMGDMSNTAHDHNVTLDPLAIERIEVVRGPASLLYGSSALGGVVNLITSDMPDRWDTGSSGTLAADLASVNTGGALQGRYQLGREHWATTGRISMRQSGDLKTPQGRLQGTSMNHIEGSAGAGYRTQGFSGALAIGGVNNIYGLPEELDDPDEEIELRLNQQTLQGRGIWERSGFFRHAELRLHASRMFQQEIEIEYEPDGWVDEDVELEFLQYAANSTFTLRHRPVGLFDEGVFGANFYLLTRDVGGEEAFTPGVTSRTMALFTYQEIPINATTRLQFGLRGESNHIEPLTNDDFSTVPSARTNAAVSGSVGLNVRPVRTVEIGAQLARAHRFPILEELFADGVHFGAGIYEVGDKDLKTETSMGADLFVRFATPVFRAELATFHYRINDYVALEPEGRVFIDDRGREWDVYSYRAADARLSGAELETRLRLHPKWQLQGSMDYVYGRRVDTDEALPVMPPLRYRMALRYQSGPWWSEARLRHVTAQNRVVENELPTDGYTLLGLSAGFNLQAGGTHSLVLRAENLANTTYRDHLSRVDRSEFGFPMPARNVRLTWSYQF